MLKSPSMLFHQHSKSSDGQRSRCQWSWIVTPKALKQTANTLNCIFLCGVAPQVWHSALNGSRSMHAETWERHNSLELLTKWMKSDDQTKARTYASSWVIHSKNRILVQVYQWRWPGLEGYMSMSDGGESRNFDWGQGLIIGLAGTTRNAPSATYRTRGRCWLSWIKAGDHRS